MSKYILMLVMHHADGTTKGVELHRGTKESCEAEWERLPPMLSTSDPTVTSSELLIGTEEQWERSTYGVLARPS